MNKHL